MPRVRKLWGVWTPFDSEDPNPPLVELIDEFHFDFAVLAKGRRQPLFGQALEDYRKRRAAKVRTPRPPTVQVLLKQAYEWKEWLDRSPGLTRDALAREVGVYPTRLTMILNLLNLASEIQQHILTMPPTTGWGLITERRLRPLARMLDQEMQRLEFERLLARPRRARKIRESEGAA